MDQLKKKYQGIIPPIITPVDENENVDEQGLRALVNHCVEGGLHGIFVAGTNGESLGLTQRERNRAISIALDQACGRITVVCGTMDSSTRRVIENLKELEQMGGTCAVVTPIFYARHTSQDETVRHFEAISRASSIDLLIYNIPSVTGLNIKAATVSQIAGFEHVAGYKDSSGNYTDFLTLLARYNGTPFCCLQGTTPHGVSSLLMGADGMVPALGPLFPEIFTGAYRAGKSGDVELAWKYNELIRETSKILTMSLNSTAAAKFAISTLGFAHKRIIAPQDMVKPEEEQRMMRQIEAVRELYDKQMK